MAAKTARHDEPLEERPSGVPPPGRLGASSGEFRWLLLGAAVIVLIILATWYESMH